MARSSSDSVVERFTGRVKWFNLKNGYGFITPVNENALVTDIFVHHSSIFVSKNQYKYLTEGEYVDFDIEYTENSEHKYHATNVTGVARGLLLCETKFDILEENRKRTNLRRLEIPQSPQTPRTPQTPRAPRPQRQDRQDEDDFEFPKQKNISRQSTR